MRGDTFFLIQPCILTARRACRITTAMDKGTSNEREREACQIVKTLTKAGFVAYFAGGCVRDRFWGLEPGDIDIATSADSETVLRLFPGSKHVGKAFGVSLVTVERFATEVASFRIDGPYRDGRRPEWVRPAQSAAEDARRRDFTINGLFFDPLSGRILDTVDGISDLERHVLRAIGEAEARFEEDWLRLYRAVRFAARFGLRIEDRTGAAMRKLAPCVSGLAPERVREELDRILTGPRPHLGLRLLDEFGLLSPWLPEVSALHGVTQSPVYHPEGDAFEHTVKVLEHLEAPGPELAFAALLHDIGKALTRSPDGESNFARHTQVGAELVPVIGERLRFSRERTERVAALVGDHGRFKDFPVMRPSTRKRFLAMPHLRELLALHKADCLSGGRSLAIHDDIASLLDRKPESLALPAPLINGRDLLDCGVSPGPMLGRILEAVREKQLQGELENRESALDFARRFSDTSRQ